MNLVRILIVIIAFTAVFITAQSERHNWRALPVAGQHLWYDAMQLDTIKSNTFEIWVLELHNPQISYEGLKTPINRTKTLYSVDIEKGNYAIKMAVLYDNSMKEIGRFDYTINIPPGVLPAQYPILKSGAIDVICSIIKQRIVHNGKS
ncbi:MAG: hypothetical protein LWX56_03130 [Ignavibacteria bacterium]|nr:hypothetical protein [Ignavibacteria bacterium]